MARSSGGAFLRKRERDIYQSRRIEREKLNVPEELSDLEHYSRTAAPPLQSEARVLDNPRGSRPKGTKEKYEGTR
jgi:hypothetical protein